MDIAPAAAAVASGSDSICFRGDASPDGLKNRCSSHGGNLDFLTRRSGHLKNQNNRSNHNINNELNTSFESWGGNSSHHDKHRYRNLTNHVQNSTVVSTKDAFVIGMFVFALIQMFCWTQLILPHHSAAIESISRTEMKANISPQEPQLTFHNSSHYIPIFYNLFVNNASDVDRVYDIVTQQLAFRNPHVHYPIYVNTIGYDLYQQSSSYTMLNDFIHMQHYNDANEKVTLQSLWEYCQNNTDQKVVYLHSKGSYSNTLENEQLRTFLTAGALSVDCRQLESFHCNVCSSRFSPLPHPHTSGNMWLAECHYVQRLQPPVNFAAKMRAFKHKGSPACTGRMRWAAEHWIHSHPTVQPCDLYTDATFLFNYEHLPSAQEVISAVASANTHSKLLPPFFELRPAPRFDLATFVKATSGVCNGTGGGTLTDRLEEYTKLYKERPDDTWWGWKFWGQQALP
jgi:hypothetical protein